MINITLFDNQITTEVKKFDSFYKAENYHQGYYKLNTEQPYCNAVITPKVSKARKLLEKYY
jgi:peptide-methionine (S)-S-oxide reductase